MAQGKSADYVPSIDGIRALAVLAVFLFHIHRGWLPGGFVGVDVFFVISGFLISSTIIRDHRAGRFTFGRFYQRRIARLHPAFFFVAAGTFVTATLTYADQDLSGCGGAIAAAAISLANMRSMLQGTYFAASPDAQPLLHCWSLSVEEQFYLFFPAFLVALLALSKKKGHRPRALGLWVLFLGSFGACVVVTARNPVWAFYLLPTRAWELVAGALLAEHLDDESFSGLSRQPSSVWWRVGSSIAKGTSRLSVVLSWTGLALVVLSLVLCREGASFPGYQALPPVLGTAMLLATATTGAFPQTLLSAPPLVFVGRLSYSLYLVHWPVFSFVDYTLFTHTALVRTSLKVVLSVAAASLCYYLVEAPGRAFLNARGRRPWAFAFLGAALVVLVPLGTFTKKRNYRDGTGTPIASGGLVARSSGTSGQIVLMGDSLASMFGKMMVEIATEKDYRLNIISESGQIPIPLPNGENTRLWLDSLAYVESSHPDVVILACHWRGKLHGDIKPLQQAVDELRKHTRNLILITQPPELPVPELRSTMRDGGRPPFWEQPTEAHARMINNELVKKLEKDNVHVLDIERHLREADGSIRIAAPDGRLLYFDADHLTQAGVELSKGDLVRLLIR